MNIKKNDRVMVIAGREKGKVGKVLKVVPEKERLIVEKVNMVKRHTKPAGKNQGGIMEKEGPLHISNVMVMCDKCAAPRRLGRKVLEDGSHVRFCKKCGEHVES
ncbi:MAG: 50S ribosomal protein L24 [Desulfarculus sp.]|nr:50S ribosomal protein L24 [Desulfarculus sp.]